MGKGRGISIIVGVVLVVAGIAYVAMSQGTEAFRNLNPIDMTQSFTKEPIQVYNNCMTEMLTDKGRPLQSATVKCYEDNVKWSMLDRPLIPPIASFKFGAPAALEDSGLTCFACRSKVYQYGENDFQLGLFDEVGEKKYDVKRWELPS